MRAVAAIAVVGLAACKGGGGASGPDKKRVSVTAGEGNQLARFSTRDTFTRVDLAPPWSVAVTVNKAPDGSAILVAGQPVTTAAPATIDVRAAIRPGPGGPFMIPVEVETPGAERRRAFVDAARLVRESVLADPKLGLAGDDVQRADAILWVRRGDAGAPVGVIGRGDRLDAVDLVAIIEETATDASCGTYESHPSFGISSSGTSIQTHYSPGGERAEVGIRVHTAEVRVVDQRTGAEVARTTITPDDEAVASACPGTVSLDKDGNVPGYHATADRQIAAWLTERLALCTTCGAAPVAPDAGIPEGRRLDDKEGFVASSPLPGDDGKRYLAVTIAFEDGGGTVKLGQASWPVDDRGVAGFVIDPSKLIGGAVIDPTSRWRAPIQFAIERGQVTWRAEVDADVDRDAALARIVAATGGITFGAGDTAGAAPRGAILVRPDATPELLGAATTVSEIDLVVTVASKDVKKSRARCAYTNALLPGIPQDVKVTTVRATLELTARDRRTGAVVATETLPPPKAEKCPDRIGIAAELGAAEVDAVASDADVVAWVTALLPAATSTP